MSASDPKLVRDFVIYVDIQLQLDHSDSEGNKFYSSHPTGRFAPMQVSGYNCQNGNPMWAQKYDQDRRAMDHCRPGEVLALGRKAEIYLMLDDFPLRLPSSSEATGRFPACSFCPHQDECLTASAQPLPILGSPVLTHPIVRIIEENARRARREQAQGL